MFILNYLSYLTDSFFLGTAPRVACVILQQESLGGQRTRWHCLRLEHSLGRPARVCLPLAIGCSHCALLGLSPQPYHRRHLLWTDSSLGHSRKVFARPEDPSLCGRSYPSSVRPRHGRHSKCSQSDQCQYGWNHVFMAAGYVGTASGNPGVGLSFPPYN